MSQTRGCARQVTIVSTNAATLDGLQTYLRGAGVVARCAGVLDRCVKSSPAMTIAFILFPDEFRWESVVATLADLAAQRPRALAVLVTAHPDRFELLTAPAGALIVPRPVWGWTILDALRAHHERHQSLPKERARAR